MSTPTAEFTRSRPDHRTVRAFASWATRSRRCDYRRPSINTAGRPHNGNGPRLCPASAAQNTGWLTNLRRAGWPGAMSAPLLMIAVGVCGGSGVTYLINVASRRRLCRDLKGARHAATHDPLTGAPNRNAVFGVLRRYQKEGTALSAMIIDVDGLKVTNDSYGHVAGDQVLRHVANQLASAIPAGMIGRLGGDEFVVILPGGLHLASEMACKARRSIADHPIGLPCGNQLTVTASIGVAATDGEAESLDLVLRRADSAMYAAKRSGRGICTYDVNIEDSGMSSGITES